MLDEVEQWFLDLCETAPEMADRVEAAIDRLVEFGPGLGRPWVDTLSRSKIRNLKELRPGACGSARLRLLFVFDPDRKAIFLVGGDKSGRWERWYRDSIKLAEKRYLVYLRDSGQ